MAERVNGRNLKERCHANMRNCRACGYRYKKGETRWQDDGACPICGEERQCKQASVFNGLCKAHGGGSPKKGRIAGRPPKDGIFRHLLPERMLQAYDEALGDERLTELRRDIALLEARRADLIKRAEKGESGALWKKVQDTWKEYRRAKRDGYESAEYFLNLEKELDDHILRGAFDFAAWKEIENVTGELRRGKVDEHRRLKEMQQLISVERVLGLMGKLVQAINAIVDDRQQKTAITLAVKGLLEAHQVVDAEYKEIQ